MALFVPLSFNYKGRSGIKATKYIFLKQMMGLVSEETVVLPHWGSDKANLEVSNWSQITTIRIL